MSLLFCSVPSNTDWTYRTSVALNVATSIVQHVHACMYPVNRLAGINARCFSFLRSNVRMSKERFMKRIETNDEHTFFAPSRIKGRVLSAGNSGGSFNRVFFLFDRRRSRSRIFHNFEHETFGVPCDSVVKRSLKCVGTYVKSFDSVVGVSNSRDTGVLNNAVHTSMSTAMLMRMTRSLNTYVRKRGE